MITSTSRVSVLVEARDPILKAGVVSHLRTRPEVRLLTETDDFPVEVTVVVVDTIDDRDPAAAQAAAANHQESDGAGRRSTSTTPMSSPPPKPASSACSDATRPAPTGWSPRSSAPRAARARCRRTCSGSCLDQVGALQRGLLGPRGLTFNGLATREIEVLRLVADGCDTHEIADKLAYSERTVKNVLHDVTTRLQLRNRSHAVAYALRQGLI